MTEIETEVKIEREQKLNEQRTANAFSSRSFSPAQSDLKKFDTYKPTDLTKIFNELENKNAQKENEETDLDNFVKLEGDAAPVVFSKSVETDEPRASLKINLKGKLTIFVASVAMVLLVFLAIFNAFRISALKSSISELDKEIYYNEQVINAKINEYNILTADSLLEGKAQSLNFDEIAESNQHSVKIKKVKSSSAEEEESKTNWFDKVCSWLSSFFGA